MKDRSEKIYHEVDALIKNGKINEAHLRLKRLKRTELSSTYRAKIASLARRADLPQISLILLRPYVRPTESQFSVATDEEKSEYAAALADMGAGVEAIKLLSEVDQKKYPSALLHTAFAYFSQWDYASAIPVLTEFLAHPEITKQQRIVGRVNLAASLVHEKDMLAEKLLSELLEESIASNYTLAEGFIRMLSAEYNIYTKNWERVEQHLHKSEKIYSGTNAVEGLFVRKWKAIFQMYNQGSKDRANVYLDPIRHEAKEKKHWETLRDCDFNEAVYTRNEDLFLKVYFGSYFPAKKQRLLKEYNEEFKIPDSYNWNLSDVGKGSKCAVDILRDNGTKALSSGQASYRLFFSLSSDFYRPLRIAELHSHAYQNEFFNPLSSPSKVHQGVCRLRQWLRKENIPLEIKEEEGSYQLLSKQENVTILIPHLQMATSRTDAAIQRLKQAFGSRESFSLKEASEVLGGSYWQVNRLLKHAEDENKVYRTAKGRSTRYSLINDTPLKKSA